MKTYYSALVHVILLCWFHDHYAFGGRPGLTTGWNIPPLTHSSGEVPFATTGTGYGLACLPTPEGRQHCSSLATAAGKELHYVELTRGGTALKSYCVSTLEGVAQNFNFLCGYDEGEGDAKKVFDVVDIEAANSAEGVEKCQNYLYLFQGSRHEVVQQSGCQESTNKSEVVKECEKNGGKPPKPTLSSWTYKENFKSLCEVKSP